MQGLPPSWGEGGGGRSQAKHQSVCFGINLLAIRIKGHHSFMAVIEMNGAIYSSKSQKALGDNANQKIQKEAIKE